MNDVELAKKLFKARNEIYGKLKGDMIKNIVNIECKSKEDLPEILEYAIELTLQYYKSPDLDLYFCKGRIITKELINFYIYKNKEEAFIKSKIQKHEEDINYLKRLLQEKNRKIGNKTMHQIAKERILMNKKEIENIKKEDV